MVLDQQTAFDLILPYFPAAIQDLIMDESISDLMFTGGLVFVDRNGKIEEADVPAMADRALRAAIESIARQLGKDVTEEDPILNSRLADGSRVAAMLSPVATSGTCLTIRRFCRQFTLDELLQAGCIDRNSACYLIGAILKKKNILVSGGTGSGKTTLLNSLIQLISPNERLIAIENPAELKISQRCTERWESIDPLPLRPEITVGHLVKAALRHRPDRIIVGEIRDQAAYNLLEVMNTGHGGTLSTIHANSAVDALYRISNKALSYASNLSPVFIRQETASAIDVVVHIERGPDGKRRVTEVVENPKYKDDVFEVEEIYKDKKK